LASAIESDVRVAGEVVKTTASAPTAASSMRMLRTTYGPRRRTGRDGVALRYVPIARCQGRLRIDPVAPVEN
jgi:hypothetical protein